MPALDASLRSTLENLIVKARDASEAAAEAALRRLAVHETSPYPSMSKEARALRWHLRAKARQLADPLEGNKQAPMPGLVRECAYARAPTSERSRRA